MLIAHVGYSPISNSKILRWFYNVSDITLICCVFDVVFLHHYLIVIYKQSLLQARPTSCLFIPVPCQIGGGPSSRSPRQCKCGHQLQKCMAKWPTLSTAPALLSALDGYQTVLPSSTRPSLAAVQRPPYRAHMLPSRFSAPYRGHASSQLRPLLICTSLQLSN